jgi:hypothetical protein
LSTLCVLCRAGYDERITGQGTSDHGRGMQVVSRAAFRQSMGRLRDERQSIEGAARRSSVAFQRFFPFASEKEALDKFLLLLARGATVTRHQSFKYAERVTLFSTTGCRSIEWDKPGSQASLAPREVRVKRRHKGLRKFWCTRRLFDACAFGTPPPLPPPPCGPP